LIRFLGPALCAACSGWMLKDKTLSQAADGLGAEMANASRSWRRCGAAGARRSSTRSLADRAARQGGAHACDVATSAVQSGRSHRTVDGLVNKRGKLLAAAEDSRQRFRRWWTSCSTALHSTSAFGAGCRGRQGRRHPEHVPTYAWMGPPSVLPPLAEGRSARVTARSPWNGPPTASG